MKIRAKANGEVIDASEEAAKELIEAGVYEPVDEPADAPKKKSTKVEPLTTENTPPLARKAK